MIKPTLGRIVWFTPAKNDAMPKEIDGRCAAIITKVWSDTSVNLTVFDANGNTHSRTSVALVQDEQERPGSYYAEWMPYQKDQAKKAETLKPLAAK